MRKNDFLDKITEAIEVGGITKRNAYIEGFGVLEYELSGSRQNIIVLNIKIMKLTLSFLIYMYIFMLKY
jgi:hypothetical protein